MNIKSHRVLNILQNNNSLDRFAFVIVDIWKDIDTNTIKRVKIPRNGMYESESWKSVKGKMVNLYRSKKPNYLISTTPNLMKNSFHYDLYNRGSEDEHSLASLYIQNFSILESSAGALQQLLNGEGVFLREGDSVKPLYKIDPSQLRMATYAIMFSMDLMTKNKTHTLIQAFMEMN